VDEAVVLTFEEMAFLDVASGPGEVSPPAQEGPWLFLSYTVPAAGSFALYLPKVVKFAIAEAIYGEDENGITPVQLDDSLLEVMNVLAGRLLTIRFGAASTYTMGLPTVLYDPPPEAAGFERHQFKFHVDEHQLTLIWQEASA
jgi:hypothetical protein